MNCGCSPPIPAVIRRVSREGPNHGREFFTCANSKCQFFAWASSTTAPPSSYGKGRVALLTPTQSGTQGYGATPASGMPPAGYPPSYPRGPPTGGYGAPSGGYGASSGGYGAKSNNASNISRPKVVARFSIFALEMGPPFTVRISLVFSLCSELTNLLYSFRTDTPAAPAYDSVVASDTCEAPKSRKFVEYDRQWHMWLMDFDSYELISAKIAAHNWPFLRVEDIPTFLTVGLKSYSRRISSLPIEFIDPTIPLNITDSLLDSLLPFQVQGVQFVVSRGGRALIGDDMGCGKTVQAIACIQHYRRHWPALVLAPVNLMQQWFDELLRFSEGLLTADDIVWVKKATDAVGGGKICLVAYSIMDKLERNQRLSAEQFGMVVCDESHNLKSHDSKRTLSVLPFLKRAEVAICLTGTPAVNRPVELYTQLHGLLPSVFSSYDQFVRRYCDAKPSRFAANTLDVKGSSNETELKKLLETLVMVRRLKAEVISDLPVKHRDLRYIDPDSSIVPELNRLQRESQRIEAALKSGGDPASKTRLTREREQVLLRYYQATGMSKIQAIREELFKQIDNARLDASITFSTLVSKAPTNHSDIDGAVDNSTIEKAPPGSVLMELEEDIMMEDSEKQSDREVIETIEDSDTDDMQTISPCATRKRIRRGTEPATVSGEQSGEYSPLNETKRTRVDSDLEEEDDHENISNPKSSAALSKKILVFAHHQIVLDAIEEVLQEASVGYRRIDGTTPAARKTRFLDDFKNDDNVSVALLSITACGTGLNLTRASIAIFAELYWSPGVVLQAEDRIHRLGQKEKDVRIVYVLAKGTADDIVWESIQKKYAVLGATIGNDGGSNGLRTASASNAVVANSAGSSQRSVKGPVQTKLNLFLSGTQPVDTDGAPVPLAPIFSHSVTDPSEVEVVDLLSGDGVPDTLKQPQSVCDDSTKPYGVYALSAPAHIPPSVTETCEDVVRALVAADVTGEMLHTFDYSITPDSQPESVVPLHQSVLKDSGNCDPTVNYPPSNTHQGMSSSQLPINTTNQVNASKILPSTLENFRGVPSSKTFISPIVTMPQPISYPPATAPMVVTSVAVQAPSTTPYPTPGIAETASVPSTVAQHPRVVPKTQSVRPSFNDTPVVAPNSSTQTTLSAEQLARIERNRLEALARRSAALRRTSSATPVAPLSVSHLPMAPTQINDVNAYQTPTSNVVSLQTRTTSHSTPRIAPYPPQNISVSSSVNTRSLNDGPVNHPPVYAPPVTYPPQMPSVASGEYRPPVAQPNFTPVGRTSTGQDPEGISGNGIQLNTARGERITFSAETLAKAARLFTD